MNKKITCKNIFSKYLNCISNYKKIPCDIIFKKYNDCQIMLSD